MQSKEDILISVIICTFKIPDFFYLTLDSIINQNISPNKYEIIIVDYNTSNIIPSPIQDIIGQSKCNIIYSPESRKGLSTARNTGIKQTNSEIVAFIDDDAVADPDWLSSILEIYEKDIDAWAVGGKVLPIWGAKRPDWLDDTLLRMLSIVEWGEECRPLIWPERLIGTNISFKKVVFSKIGFFNVKLGRKGKILIGGEDTEIQERIHQINKRVMYTPKAIVNHLVPQERLTKNYFLNRSYGNGRSVAIQSYYENKKNTILKCLPQKSLDIAILFAMQLFCKSNPKLTFFRWRSIASYIGFIHQSIILILTNISHYFNK